jgi:outer membrane protein
MTFKHSHPGLVGALALTAALGATNAFAQAASAAKPAAAPAPVIAHGPAIPGVCVLYVNQAIADSTVGKFVISRLQQINQQVNQELTPEGTALATDEKAFQGRAATLDAATRQSQGQALQARDQAFQQKADLRQREFAATREKALNRVAQELDPIAQQLYQQHRCSILVNRTSLILFNPDMDLTPAAVTALNARIQQFSFEREHLDTALPQAPR